MLRGWSEHDQSTATALTLYEAGLCSGCGHPVAEAHAWEADPANFARSVAYESPPPARCHACTAVAQRASEYEGDDIRHPSALRFAAHRVTDT